MGININDSTQDFTGQILRGEKTIETRSTRSLDPYIGERVGLIRTGVGKATLVGYATVGEPVFYDSVAKFRKDYDKHLVAPGSAFDIKDRLKYGYPLMQVEAVDPRQVESRGIVARRLNPVARDSDSAYLDAVRRGDMKTAQRMVDAAANAAGYTIESFHGTNGDLFTVFDPEKGGEKTAAESARLGIFSTDNAKVAQSYAENLGMGGAMGLAFGSGPFAKARADALETPQGKRLMQELEDSKQAVQKAHQKVRKEVSDKVMKQVESNPDLLDIVKRYGNEFLTSMVNNAWVANEMHLSKPIVDAEKDQSVAEERLSDYIMPFIIATYCGSITRPKLAPLR
jgi:BMFP domain-containing protein YqiC